MSFGAPLWFWALALLPAALALFFWNENRRARLLQKIVAARLMSDLAASVSSSKRRFRFLILLAGLACVIVALARPQLGYTWQQTQRKGRDVIIAIDTSKSMLATDLPPNRLTRAKLAAQDLINLLPGDRVGVIAFAGDAFLQAPLTIDYSAVLDSINELDTKIIPRGGTDITAAIKTAAEAFGKGESENRALIIMTDGEDLEENAVQSARDNASSFRIFTVGIGSGEGSVIPLPDEQGGTTFVKDSGGQIVKTKLDESRLREIAQAAGGFYVSLQNGPAAMQEIFMKGLEPMREHDIDARTSRQPIERYQWPLALGLALLAWSLLIGERKRRARSLALATALLLMMTPCAFCANPGVEMYDKHDFKQALDEFQTQLARDPKSDALHFDEGTAAYKLGDYDKALEAFGQAVTTPNPGTRAKAEYNIGNTLFQRGAKQEEKPAKIHEWRNAIEHYDEALKAEPNDENTKINRDTVQKLIAELEKEPPKQQHQNQQNQKQDQQKNQQQNQQNQSQPNQQNQGQQKNQSQQNQNQQQQQNQQNQNQQNQQSQNQQQNAGQSNQQKSRNENQPQNQQQKGSQQNQQQQNPSQSDQKGQDQNNPQQNQPKPGDESQQQANSQPGNQRPAPSAAPSPGDQKLSGDIKAQPSGQKSGEQKGDESAEAEPVKPGEMSKEQARALIDSLQGEEARVQLNEHPHSSEVLKDW